MLRQAARSLSRTGLGVEASRSISSSAAVWQEGASPSEQSKQVRAGG